MRAPSSTLLSLVVMTHILKTKLRTTTTDRSVISPIVEDTKSLMSLITGDVITHIRRTANRVADRMARFAQNIGIVTTWFEEPPDFIIDLLFEDCN